MGEIILWLVGLGEQVTKLISGSAKSIIDLRVFAIFSNLCGAVLNGLTGAWPQCIQNSLEVPVHAWRLVKTRRAMREIDRAEDPAYAVAIIKKLSTKRSYKIGETIFAKGDFADAAYVVDSGSVKVVEPNVTLEEGQLFGEMGLFLDDKQRTATMIATRDVVLSQIAYTDFEALYRKNPEVGFAVMRLMSRRFSAAIAMPSNSAMMGTPS